jgi:hypothetical protein
MAEFKPMVKMETTEPSVMLKLKKGGHVNSKDSKGDSGHSSMKRMAMGGPMQPMPPQMAGNPMARAMAARRPMVGAGMPPRKPMAPPPAPMAAPSPQPQMNTPTMKKGGKVSDTAQDKAMIMKAFKEHDAQEHKGGKGTKLKLATGGLTNPMKKGGAVMDSAQTKTTIKGNEGKFEKTKMERKKTDPGYERYATGGVANGMATGGVVNGMKKGGATKKHFATGGSVSTGRAVAMPKKAPSQPVRITKLAGTFKKGGPVCF